jgi:hypothetical protein
MDDIGREELDGVERRCTLRVHPHLHQVRPHTLQLNLPLHPGPVPYTPWTPIYPLTTPRSPPGSPMFIPTWCFLHSPDNLAIRQGRPDVPCSRASHHVLRHCPLYIHATTRTFPYIYAGPQHSANGLMLRPSVSAHGRLDRASEFDGLLDDTVLRHERVTLQTCHRIHQRTLMDRRSVDPQLRLLLHSEFCS